MTTTADGRSTRWDEHRAQRRIELVQSTLRAIRSHGASVGMDEIAAQAGTSKTVIYRHFGDRTGLYMAVVDWVHSYILKGLNPAFARAGEADPVEVVRELSDSYLRLVDRDPEIYRFVVNRPAPDAEPAPNLVDDFVGFLGGRLAAVLAAKLDEPGLAETWGHGIVGLIRSVADQWLLSGRARPRERVVDDLVALLQPALTSPALV